MRFHLTVIGLLSVSLLATASAGAGSERSAAETLTLYSGQHPQTTSLLVADFQKRTGIKVRVRSGSEDELANQVLQEKSHSPADIFYAENPPALTALEEHGLLAPVAAATLAKVPAGVSSPKHDWVGVSARESVLVYNTKKLSAKQVPTHLLDLEASKWEGVVGFAPNESDFQPLISAVIKLKGEAAAVKWVQSLQVFGNYADNESLVAAVNRGEVELGLIDHYYWYRLRDELGAKKIHSALAYFAPGDPGALVDVSGAGILKSSDKQALAQKFLEYLVSKPAQTIIATSHSYEYPLLKGVTNKQVARPLSALGSPSITVADLGDGKKALDLLVQAGLL